MNFSAKGIPILTMREKLDSLDHCIAQEAWEDAAGHLCDILAHVGKQIKPSVGEPFQGLRELVEYYGADPTPIVEDEPPVQPPAPPIRYRSIDEPWGQP